MDPRTGIAPKTPNPHALADAVGSPARPSTTPHDTEGTTAMGAPAYGCTPYSKVCGSDVGSSE